MRFTYHIGLHCTDEDRALDCLLANAGALARQGCAVAPPDRFRPALREAMLELKGAPAPAAMQERLLDAVTDMDAPAHVLFSSDSFLCVPRRAVADGTLYPLAEERAPWIRNLFPEAPAHFALAMRNPATLVPALQARFADRESWQEFVGRIDPEALSWTDMLARLRAAVPDAEITVWCTEDAPLLWPDLLARLAGTAPDAAPEGGDDFVADLMSPEGFTRLQGYLAENPARDAGHRRRVVAAFLDRFARPEAVADEYDLPGWDADRVARLTERYEADIARIGAMEGVTLLLP